MGVRRAEARRQRGDMANCIEIKNLDFFYGDFHALKKINLGVPKNSIVSLIGPSGCGKSTLLKVLDRMCDLNEGARAEGEIIFDGRDIFDPAFEITELRKRVGMVFQQPNPFPLSVRDNVEYGPRVHGVTDRGELEKIVFESLSGVMLWDSLKDCLDRPATELLPDEQQRLCIARLMAVGPDVLLMDEPCSTLDPISTLGVEELMQKLKERYTIVIVTHNMQQAARASDYSGFMLMGELVEYSETGILFSRPRDRRTDDYISGHYG